MTGYKVLTDSYSGSKSPGRPTNQFKRKKERRRQRKKEKEEEQRDWNF